MPIPLEELFAQALLPDAELQEDGVCELELDFESQRAGLRSVPCATTEAVGDLTVSAFELIDPSTGGAVVDCAGALARIAVRNRTTTVIHRSSGFDREPLGFLSGAAHAQLPDGTLVALVEGDDTVPGFEGCESFPGAAQKVRSTGVEWSPPGEAVWSLAFPQVSDRSANDVPLAPAILADGSGVIAIIDRTVWRLPLDRGGASAIALAELPADQFDLDDFAFAGTGLGVGVGEDSMVFVGLRNQEVAEIEVAVGDTPEIVYADPQRVVVQLADSERSLRVIDLS